MDRTGAARPVGLSSEEVRRKKTSFTLDFASTTGAQQSDAVAAKRAKQDLLNEGILRSPDVSLLALTTPDLERLIMHGVAAASATTPPGAAAAASIVTTPTQVLFPRSVTEEQEAYARGFLDALIELQRQQQQKAASSPHLQVVPDPRTGLLLPLTSPSDEGQTSLYTTLAPLSRVVTQQPSDPGSKHPLLEFVPSQAMPLSVLRPGTLSLSDALSPVARRSALVPAFGVKPFAPFVNDSETLDLSPSGRFAARNMEQSVSVDRRSVQSNSSGNVEHPNGGDAGPLVVDIRCELSSQDIARERLTAEVPNEPVAVSAVHNTLTMNTFQSTSANAIKEPPAEANVLPTQPIDMSIQELAKIERKREKNRYAAQKCRMLKLERISRLETRVAELKEQNKTLAGTSGSLRDEVNQLKQLIVQHVEGGCQIMTVHSLQAT